MRHHGGEIRRQNHDLRLLNRIKYQKGARTAHAGASRTQRCLPAAGRGVSMSHPPKTDRTHPSGSAVRALLTAETHRPLSVQRPSAERG